MTGPQIDYMALYPQLPVPVLALTPELRSVLLIYPSDISAALAAR
jgi:hypothetical protein